MSDDSVALIRRASDAYGAGDLQLALELAETAGAQAGEDLQALSLFWRALALDGLGERDEATAVWRRVRDHPRANASDPLLSLRAANNLSIQAAHLGRDATDEREALTAELLLRLKDPAPRTISALTQIAFDHIRVLARSNQVRDVARLAPIVLKLAESQPSVLSDEQVFQLSIWNLEAQIVMRDPAAGALSMHTLANGGAPALQALDGWAARLQAAGGSAHGQFVLFAAHLRILVLHELNRPADAAEVRDAAMQTSAARDPQLAAMVEMLQRAPGDPET